MYKFPCIKSVKIRLVKVLTISIIYIYKRKYQTDKKLKYLFLQQTFEFIKFDFDLYKKYIQYIYNNVAEEVYFERVMSVNNYNSTTNYINTVAVVVYLVGVV